MGAGQPILTFLFLIPFLFNLMNVSALNNIPQHYAIKQLDYSNIANSSIDTPVRQIGLNNDDVSYPSSIAPQGFKNAIFDYYQSLYNEKIDYVGHVGGAVGESITEGIPIILLGRSTIRWRWNT